MTQISKATVSLMAELCETATPTTTGATMKDLFPNEGAEAIRCGAFRSGAPQTRVPDRYHDEHHYVDVEWDQETKGYRYPTPHVRGGWVAVPKEDMLTWNLDMDWFVGWIAEQFDLAPSISPRVLIPDILWYLGTPWIRKRRSGLFFTRRVSFNEVYDQVVDALRNRSGEPPGVILTTSRWMVKNVEFPGRHRVIQLRDCLVGDHTATIDINVVANRLFGNDDPTPIGPLQYNNDYSLITVNGRSFVFRGDKQKQVIGSLIHAWNLGEKKVRTQIILEDADSSAGQIQKLFKGHRDWRELIEYGDGFCWLLI